jgi:hypothetical protein
MNDISIVFFGKPDSFESFEVNVSGTLKIDYFEPELKLHQESSNIIHLFKKEKYHFFEVYSYAKANNSGRSGIIIGVSIKSKNKLKICSENYSEVNSYLEHFKKNALNGSVFDDITIENTIKRFQLKFENITRTLIFEKENYKSENKTLLLYLPDFNGKLNVVNEKIGFFENIYISSDKSVFTADINMVFLSANENKFFILNEKNRLSEYIEPVTEKKNGLTESHSFLPELENSERENLTLKKELSDLKIEQERINSYYKRRIVKLIVGVCIASVSLLTVLTLDYFEINLVGKAKKGIINLIKEKSHTTDNQDKNKELKKDDSSTDAAKSINHIVKPGESLSEIAEKYGCSVEEIMNLNGITDQSKIEINQELLIPGK